MTSQTPTLRSVWKNCPANIQQDVEAFWTAHNLLEAGPTLEARKAEIAVVAYEGDTLVAVSTINIQPFVGKDIKFGFYRSSVHPDLRHQGVARLMIAECETAISAWSQANPEERVLGLATIVENEVIKQTLGHLPVWRNSQMVLIGYTDKGHEVRMKWFDHAEI